MAHRARSFLAAGACIALLAACGDQADRSANGPDASGSGTVASGQPAQPGSGLNGGLGMTGSFPSGTGTSATMGNAADGSPYTGSKDAAGQR